MRLIRVLKECDNNGRVAGWPSLIGERVYGHSGDCWYLMNRVDLFDLVNLAVFVGNYPRKHYVHHGVEVHYVRLCILLKRLGEHVSQNDCRSLEVNCFRNGATQIHKF